MKKAVYKTNINCGMCLSKVKPFLDSAKTITQWSVDIGNKDRLLKVEGTELDVNEVEALVKEAGYRLDRKRRLLGFN